MHDSIWPAPEQPGSLIEIVRSRLPDAITTTAGLRSRCPGHGGRKRSLSTFTDHNGRVHLKCHSRGCSAETIADALGLSAALFGPRPRDEYSPPRRHGPVTQTMIRDALHDEAKRFRSERGIADFERLLSHERNEIRRRVAARLGTPYRPRPRSIADGPYGGHERDPIWPAALSHAYFTIWVERIGCEPIVPLADSPTTKISRLVFIEAEQRASRMMRRLYREALAGAR